MSDLVPVGIAGLGSYMPEKRLSNRDLEQLVDTSDDWIVQRTGIRERRVAADGQLTSEIAAAAARQALENAGVAAEDVDLIICCTVTGDQPFPATACRVGKILGAERAGGWDLSAACSGFLYGVQVATQFLATGTYQNVVVIGAEILSRILDYTDRDTCVLFGDGAGAALLTPLERAGHGEYLSGSMGMEGGSEDVLSVPGGGSRFPVTSDSVKQGLHYMKMGGTKVFRFAVKVFADMVETAMKPHGYDQLGLIVPHQVNQRIIEAAADRLDLPHDLFFSNIAEYGNTSAASVPIALHEAHAAGKLEDGKIICMVAFGAGMSWGHILVRW